MAPRIAFGQRCPALSQLGDRLFQGLWGGRWVSFWVARRLWYCVDWKWGQLCSIPSTSRFQTSRVLFGGRSFRIWLIAMVRVSLWSFTAWFGWRLRRSLRRKGRFPTLPKPRCGNQMKEHTWLEKRYWTCHLGNCRISKTLPNAPRANKSYLKSFNTFKFKSIPKSDPPILDSNNLPPDRTKNSAPSWDISLFRMTYTFSEILNSVYDEEVFDLTLFYTFPPLLFLYVSSRQAPLLSCLFIPFHVMPRTRTDMKLPIWSFLKQLLWHWIKRRG